MRNGLICGALAIAVACSSAPKSPVAGRDTYGPSAPAASAPADGIPLVGPPEASVGPLPLASPEPVPAYGPEPIQIRPLVLVFGPGMARGFAYAGILRALSEAKIPVGAVVGTEIGALMGAIYAQETNINHFDWALLKFNEDVFLSGQRLIPSGRLESELGKVFGEKDVGAGKIPVRIAIQPKSQGSPMLADRGPLKDAVRAALATPGLFSPADWNGAPALSAVKTRPFPIAEARALGIGPVVVFDVLGERETRDLRELEEADLVIRPDMKGIGPMDFKKRTEAAYRGKRSVADHLKEIKQWAGIPQGEP